MKLRNKRTGEIIDIYKGQILLHCEGGKRTIHFKSIEELEEWEDYEEPKTHWYIYGAEPLEIDDGNWCEGFINELKITGNYFETREEAEQTVEKLKAWKRLKDEGFRFEGIKEDYTRILQSQDPFRTGKRYLQFNKSEDEEWMEENWKDLDLLLGGEEWIGAK